MYLEYTLDIYELATLGTGWYDFIKKRIIESFLTNLEYAGNDERLMSMVPVDLKLE